MGTVWTIRFSSVYQQAGALIDKADSTAADWVHVKATGGHEVQFRDRDRNIGNASGNGGGGSIGSGSGSLQDYDGGTTTAGTSK